MVSKNKSKSIAAPKALNSSKKSNLPDGLNYEVLCHTVIPTIITYYARQKDPWDQQPTLLCDEISMILKSVCMDFKVHPKGPIYIFAITILIYSNFQVTQHLADSW